MKIDLSLVVPVYFEEDCISQFLAETIPVLDLEDLSWEIIFIDDGSEDRTCDIIKKVASENSRIKLIEFSYNQGKQAAVTAGIQYSSGEKIIYMDPDLQDPPLEIPNFIRKMNEGYDVVYGVREEKMDNFINSLFSKLFWRVLRKYTGLKIPVGLAVMRVFNRKFANKFLEYREQNRFIEGIFMHIGMNASEIKISQRKRFAGVSKFNFTKKFQLAVNAIFDFSELPLKLAVRLGILLSVLGFISLISILILKIFIDFASGWPSIMSAIVMSLGLNLFFIGVAAIYIGKIYKESKVRPLFSVKNLTNL